MVQINVHDVLEDLAKLRSLIVKKKLGKLSAFLIITMSEIKPENGSISHIHPEGRRPSGCIWINTNVRGVYLTYFMILFIRYRLYKGRLSQGNNSPLVFDICSFVSF